ncbi:MAG: hypothetical protein LBM19_04725 [Holosporales bacterium]|nr:hypothetical protein [Holosporales bacterium]
MKSEDKFIITLGGKTSIDAKLFSELVNDFTDLTQNLNQLIAPACDCRLEIQGLKEGSFEIDFCVLAEVAKTLFQNAPVVADIIKSIYYAIKITKFLKGTNPKSLKDEKDKLILENQQGESLTVDKRIGNLCINYPVIKNSVVNIINNVEKGEREHIKYSSNAGETTLAKDECNEIIKNSATATENIPKKYEIEYTLTVRKPDLMGDSKWVFKDDLSRSIEAKISDLEFTQKIKDGYIKLSGGSKIKCLLEVTEYNDSTPPSYRIIKVLEVKDKNNQLEFSFPDSKS